MNTTTYHSTVFGDNDRAARVRAAFKRRVLAQAESAGYRPARWQREIDWKAVWDWAIRVRAADFTWADRDTPGIDAIVIGPAFGGGYAIHSGQHRILAGLASGKPVPATSMIWIDVPDRTRPWNSGDNMQPNGSGFTVDELLLALAM